MAAPRGIKKVVWAVDAFEDGSKPHEHVAEMLRDLLRGTQARVEPVYVLSPEQLNLALESTTASVEHYRPAAEKALEQRVGKLKQKLPSLQRPKVVLQARSSTASAVKALASYAHSSGADLIAVGTHARKGVPRFFLGSFAESLLLYSKVPVLLAGPFTKSPGKFDHILFPTDLSRSSRALFGKVLQLAKVLKARVTVFHSLQNPIEPVFQSGVYLLGGGWVPVPAYVEEEMNQRTKSVKTLAKIAERAGVRAEAVVQAGRGGIVSSVLGYAKKNKVSLIAMAAESGVLASALIGSVTRQVVREAQCPVWVLHSKGGRRKH